MPRRYGLELPLQVSLIPFLSCHARFWCPKSWARLPGMQVYHQQRLPDMHVYHQYKLSNMYSCHRHRLPDMHIYHQYRLMTQSPPESKKNPDSSLTHSLKERPTLSEIQIGLKVYVLILISPFLQDKIHEETWSKRSLKVIYVVCHISIVSTARDSSSSKFWNKTMATVLSALIQSRVQSLNWSNDKRNKADKSGERSKLSRSNIMPLCYMKQKRPRLSFSEKSQNIKSAHKPQ